jgi:hypothetical protein
MRTLGKGVKTRGSRVVGKRGEGLFDMIFEKAGNQISEKSREDYKRFKEGKGLFDDLGNAWNKMSNDFGNKFGRREHPWDTPSFEQKGGGFDDVINHYRKVQAEKEAEKAKEYAERKSRIENAERDFRALVARGGDGYVGGNGIVGELFGDLAIEGGKKLYNFDKEHGSHLKEGVKSGLKNMVSNFFTGGRGIESATRFGRGHMRFAVMPDVMPEMNYPAVLPDVMEGSGLLDKLSKDKRFSSLPNDDVSGWIEKERRSTGYYDRIRPAILGEGM